MVEHTERSLKVSTYDPNAAQAEATAMMIALAAGELSKEAIGHRLGEPIVPA